jgi:peptidoglycan/xylan/chitin deacetylase (PgdA/CDA1 family)
LPSASPTLTPTPTDHPAGAVDIPILLYHHVAENKTDHRYYVPPALFADQMQWLVDHGYQTITEATLAEVIRHGGKLPERPVIITFDDGNEDFFTAAYPVMNQLNLVGVAFIITNRVDLPRFLSSDQLKELIDSGWEIGSHTVTHPDMVRHSVNLNREIVESKTWLDQKFGIDVVSFAYPYGLSNASIMKFVADHGYTSAVGLGARVHQSEKNLYLLSRTEIWGSFDMQQFAALMPWQ